MKFENRGKWFKESDEQEDLDILAEDELDLVEENDTLDSPEEEADAIVMDESSQKNESEDKLLEIVESFGPEDIVPVAKQMEFKKQYLQGKDKRKVNANSFYFDNVYAVDDQSGDNIPGAKLGMKYKDLAGALDKFFN